MIVWSYRCVDVVVDERLDFDARFGFFLCVLEIDSDDIKGKVCRIGVGRALMAQIVKVGEHRLGGTRIDNGTTSGEKKYVTKLIEKIRATLCSQLIKVYT